MPIRFDPGRVVATPAALAALSIVDTEPIVYLARHMSGDWGELCDLDRQANEEALVTGARLMSSYALSSGTVIWIITDGTDNAGQRHVTTVLLRDEY